VSCRLDSGSGADQDDRATASGRDHSRQCSFDVAPDAKQIDAERRLPVVLGNLMRECVATDGACVGSHNVDAAELSSRRINSTL
jgi:hypothetical protein